jgi:predicted dehydrogenase
MVRLGIAGCGAITTGIHLPNILAIEGIRVTAVADVDPAALRRVMDRVPNARAAADWHELIEGDDIDAVLVALPPALHAEAAAAVLEAGLHLYLEKPVATSDAQAERLCEIAAAADRVAMVGFNYRFNPLFAGLRDIVRGGTIGTLIAVRSCFSTHGRTTGWRADTGSGGVLLDLGSHHADLLPFIAGSPITAVSAAVTERIEGDTAAVTLRFENGVIAQSVFSAAGPEQDTVECIGETGTATVRRYESVAVELRGRDAAGARRDQLRNIVRTVHAAPYLVRKSRAPGSEPSWRTAIQEFVRSMEDDVPATPDLADGQASLAVITAAMRAAESGTTMRVEHRRAPRTRTATLSPSQ